MFDLESKIRALVDNYGLHLLLEQNEISEGFVIRYLVDENMIDVNEYFNLDAEIAEWKRIEE
jgi:hypothetical protein|tara:strand:- start:312 stop:497 length:186 start_codon:yes stop_codon:yes gene_type:complete